MLFFRYNRDTKTLNMYYKKHPNGFLAKFYLTACLALVFSLASVFAVATEVDKSEASDSVEIIAQGVGIDADSALRNAYTNAIQQALGFICGCRNSG